MINDQASTLRHMTNTLPFNSSVKNFSKGQSSVISKKPSSIRTIAVTSGKGGAGKTNFVVNIALELASLGRKVTILDADLALANADLLLGLNPHYHIGHVISGEKSLSDIVVETLRGVRLIPASSGVEELTNLSLNEQSQLMSDLEEMEHQSDFMIIDTAAGIANNVISFLCAASEVILVTNPEPTSIIDSYATIKVLHKYAPTKKIWVVVNKVIGVGDAEEVFDQLRGVAKRFLNHPIEYLGTIPNDNSITMAVREQIPVVEYAPDDPAGRSFRLIARNLDRAKNGNEISSSFWRSLVEFGMWDEE